MTALRFCPMCATPLTARHDGGRERVSCPTGHWTHWDNPLPVLAALVELDGKILLARNAAWPERRFALITGFMERDETPEQGIARELKEETDLDAQETTLIGVYEFIRKNELIIAYHVKATGEIRLSEE
ncbi:MAG: NUDIX domain-containing protein, partial [Pseudomonadota bacterium]|nr:NUDIX domain-containing protein [Pseudomonadota bacterium]